MEELQRKIFWSTFIPNEALGLSVAWLNEPFDPELKSRTDFNNARMATRNVRPLTQAWPSGTT